MSDLKRELQQLGLTLAREAADLIRQQRAHGVRLAATKSSAVDIVTDTDRAAEQLIRQRLASLRPHDAVIGEESADTDGDTGVEWVVDPIDGTVNFVYDIAAYAVSIGVQIDGEPAVGVVINVATGTEYTAVAGGEATRDGQPISVRTPTALSTALVGTGFGYDAQLRGEQGRSVAALLPQVRDIRRIGSCALDLCAVAEGSLDAYVEEGPHLWDYAAGAVIAQAAGATFARLPSPRSKGVLVCAGAEIFTDFVGLLGACGFLAKDSLDH